MGACKSKSTCGTLHRGRCGHPDIAKDAIVRNWKRNTSIRVVAVDLLELFVTRWGGPQDWRCTQELAIREQALRMIPLETNFWQDGTSEHRTFNRADCSMREILRVVKHLWQVITLEGDQVKLLYRALELDIDDAVDTGTSIATSVVCKPSAPPAYEHTDKHCPNAFHH